jgi:predicted Zn-dependent protease
VPVQDLTINAQALHDSLPRGQSACSLRLAGHVLIARLPSGETLKLDLRNAELQSSGPDGRDVVYASTIADGPSFITRDVALYRATMAAWPRDRLPAGPSSTPRRGHLTGWQWVVLVLMVGVVATVTGAVLLAGPLARVAVRAVPRSVDARIGQQAYPYALLQLGGAGAGVREDPAIRDVVQTVLDRLLVALPQNPFDLRVTVCDSPVRNAVALPGGQMIITTGMLALLDSPEELAAVLAHEINHVLYRHTMEMTVRASGLRFLIHVVSGGHLAAGITSSVWSAVSMMGTSRAMESEADRQAVRVLLAAEIDPRALVTMLDKLSTVEPAPSLERADTSEAKLAEKLRSHPLITERVRDAEDEIARNDKPAPRGFALDYQAMVAALGHR